MSTQTYSIIDVSTRHGGNTKKWQRTIWTKRKKALNVEIRKRERRENDDLYA